MRRNRREKWDTREKSGRDVGPYGHGLLTEPDKSSKSRDVGPYGHGLLTETSKKGGRVGSGSKILASIGVLGVMGSSLAFVLFSGKEVPTVGLVPAVFAVAPERVELRALNRD